MGGGGAAARFVPMRSQLPGRKAELSPALLRSNSRPRPAGDN